MSDAALQQAARLLRDARSGVVLTGAGVSAESGIPTFRDKGEGLWAKYDPADLATPDAFRRDPKLVGAWYDWRRGRCAQCEPNPGHRALADMQRLLADRGRAFTLLTQNVDRLHHRAGSTGVVELHGTIFVWRCLTCGHERDDLPSPFAEHPPRCERDAGPMRPGVVWFGEALPDEGVRRAGEAVASCDLFFSVGTSALVYPAAGYATAARARGAKVVEVNRDATPLSPSVDVALRGPSGELLPELVAAAFA